MICLQLLSIVKSVFNQFIYGKQDIHLSRIEVKK